MEGAVAFDDETIEAALSEALATAREKAPEGRVASYIPELAKADPALVGIALDTVDGRRFAVGDSEAPFTFQSASKVFTLALAMRAHGVELFRNMSVEPSGDSFHSVVRLEEEAGRPRNPYINPGAILVSDYLPGHTVGEKMAAFQAFLAELCDEEPFTVDEAVYRSESETGFRNRALAHFMRHHKRIFEPDVAVETYFRQCSVTLDARRLARIGLFLANGGAEPATGRQILPPADARTVVALMTTCGLYDEVGDFAIRVGLPAKSAVSGAILAVVPRRMTIAVFGPALGAKGNSVAGMAALECLSSRLGLSIYG